MASAHEGAACAGASGACARRHDTIGPPGPHLFVSASCRAGAGQLMNGERSQGGGTTMVRKMISVTIAALCAMVMTVSVHGQVGKSLGVVDANKATEAE